MAKKALIIGINAYDPPNALPSCVNDANTFADLARSKFGFEIVGFLTDRKASKSNIMAGIRTLVANPSDGDEFLFYYSGHGYRQQEGDHYVESIVPQDADFLTSLELAATTAGLRPAALTIVMDSCHSGGMQKAFTIADGVKAAKVKYWTPPPVEIEKAFEENVPVTKYAAFGSAICSIEDTRLVGPPTSTTKAFAIVDPQQSGVSRNFILLSACQADETAAASTERTDGKSAFTYAFLSQIGGAEQNVEALITNTGQSLRGLGVRQTPMLKVPDFPPQLTSRAFLSWTEPPLMSQSKDFGSLLLEDCWPKTPRTVPPATIPTKGFDMNIAASAPIELEKGWLDSIGSIVKVAAPIAIGALQGLSGANKGFSEQQQQVDKAWFDTLTRTIATVVPAVVQGMQSMQPTKGFETNPVPFDKGFFDSITSVAAAVVPHIVEALKNSQQPELKELSLAAQKGWFDDVTHVVSSVLPVVIGAVQQSHAGVAQKGFQPVGVDDKNFWDTLGAVAKIAVPIAIGCI